MSEDWRLRIELATDKEAAELADRLSKFDLPHELGTSFHDRVVVSRDGSEIFCYADTRQQADAAAAAVGSVAAERGWEPWVELRHWHAIAEQWEDPDAPIDPSGEHAELVEHEREESHEQGFPDFEVRVRCPSRHDARQLAERLKGEGIPNVHRWEFVVVGVEDEDAAHALADRIRAEAPAGTVVTAEASVPEAVSGAPLATPFSPFAVFGGLGG